MHEGHALDARSDARIPGGTVVARGRYEIREEIGMGGMAVVYAAHDRVTEKPVALKVVIGRYADKADTAQRYEGEKRLASAVHRHPNVVYPLDVGRLPEFHDRLYLATDLVRGRSVAALVLEHPRGLPIGQVVRIGCDLARAMVALHAQGIIHRDIKPGNIMVEGRGPAATAKLLDFGCAYATGDGATEASADLTLAHERLGTAIYMSPEQAVGIRPVPAFDIYALGATLYELLTGAAPYAGNPSAEVVRRKCALDDPPRPVGRLRDGIPVALATTVDRCLARQADDRPSATEVQRQLDAVAVALGLPTPDAAVVVAGLPEGPSGATMAPIVAADSGYTNPRLTRTAATRPAAEPTPPDQDGPAHNASVAVVAVVADPSAGRVSGPSTTARFDPTVGNPTPTNKSLVIPLLLLGTLLAGAIGAVFFAQCSGDHSASAVTHEAEPAPNTDPPAAAEHDLVAPPAAAMVAPPAPEVAREANLPNAPAATPAAHLGAIDVDGTDTDPPVDRSPGGSETLGVTPSPPARPKAKRPPTVPRWATPACETIVAEATRNRATRDWKQVLHAVTTERKCWKERERRLELHIHALAGLGRFSECVDAAGTSTNRQVRRMAKQCQHKLAEASP